MFTACIAMKNPMSCDPAAKNSDETRSMDAMQTSAGIFGPAFNPRVEKSDPGSGMMALDVQYLIGDDSNRTMSPDPL